MNRFSANRVLVAVVSTVLLHACAGGSGDGKGSSVAVEPVSIGMTASASEQTGSQVTEGDSTAGIANVALHAKITLNGGSFFTGGWGHGKVVDASTIVDGVFLPRSSQWDQGPVWWDSNDGIDRSITIDLGGVFSIDSLVIQADDNDAYLLFYRDMTTGTWQTAWNVPNYDVYPATSNWGMQTRPDPDNNEQRYVLPQPIVTDALMLKGNVDSGDRLFSVSEIQAFGISAAPVPDDNAASDGTGIWLSGYGTAAIDGIMNAKEWDNAAIIDFAVNVPTKDGGGTTPATLYVMNDKANLYLAVKIARSSFGGATNPVFEFDNNNNGIREDGDDGFGMSIGIYSPASFFDIYRYTCPGSPAGSAGCSAMDSETTRGILPSGTDNGETAATNDGAYTVIEMSHPLDSGDVLHDFSLRAGDPVGFHLTLRLFSLTPACNYGPTCYADTEVPAAISGGSYGQITVAASDVSQPLQTGIDIKPGGIPNSVDPVSEGKIPVAILSTGSFIALAKVDVSTLTFGRTGDEASLAFCNEGGEDVNGDGLDDLVCHFFMQGTGFRAGDVEGILKGRTTAGIPFSGKDSVRVVPGGAPIY